MRLFAACASGLALFLGASAAAAQTAAPTDLGRQVYSHWCSACHDAGPGHPGTAALGVKYKGSVPPELERRTDLQPEAIKYFVRHGVSVMPIFRKTEITDADLDALVAYLTHAPAPKRSAK